MLSINIVLNLVAALTIVSAGVLKVTTEDHDNCGYTKVLPTPKPGSEGARTSYHPSKSITNISTRHA
jgi:hypothetical protein